MIRFSNSFLLSLLLHALLVGGVFFSYKNLYPTESKKAEVKEKLLCLNLQSIHSSPPAKIEKKQKQVKKTPQKSLKKESLKPKKVVKKKAVLKKKKKVSKKKIEKSKTEKPKKSRVSEVENKETEQKKEPKQAKESKRISPQESYVNNNLKKIVMLLQENLYYPRRARKRGVQGSVTVRFRLSKEAVVSSVEVLSSKSDILSRGAIKTIQNLSSQFPKPEEALTITVPISYSLR
jgi:protein TonB